MSLFHFAETAQDYELHSWYDVKNTTPAQFQFVHESGNQRPILWAPNKLDEGFSNNCSYEDARMYLMFVALATGETPGELSTLEQLNKPVEEVIA